VFYERAMGYRAAVGLDLVCGTRYRDRDQIGLLFGGLIAGRRGREIDLSTGGLSAHTSRRSDGDRQ